jgi:hypothetical protein
MLAFVAVSMVGLMGMLALTLDAGAGSRHRRIAQTAADAGAIGGGQEILRLLDHATIVASAQEEATRNYSAADSIQIFHAPLTGPFAGNTQYVEVIVYKSVPTILGKIFDVASMDVRARAVAGVGSYALNCIVSLDPSAPSAIEVENGGEIDTNCGIAINSTDPNALDVNQSGEIDTGGGSIAVSGGWTGNKTPTPAPSTGVPTTINPLNYVTMPTVPACTTTGKLIMSKDTALTPGTFCGGIDIGTKTVNFAPGVYFIAGGGMAVANGGSVIGTEVTFIMTTHVSYTYAGFDFGTGCKMKLSAPTAGTWKGILMYADPSAPDYTHTFACASDDDPELTGALYFPTSDVYFIGSNSGTTVQGAVIASSVQVKGKLNVVNETSSSAAAPRLSLVE